MRSRSVVTALLTLTAGAAVSVAARRLAARRAAAASSPVVPAPRTIEVPTAPVADRDAVVLPFARPATAVPARPAGPVRCGDTGGRTKAGAPCGARGTVGGRCHHHRVAA